MSTFKFDSTSFFLTYPQSGDLEWSEIVQHLQSLKDLDWLRVCKEQHQDGTPHHHAVGKFKARFQSRNARCFDVKGKHPNIQPIRSIAKALQYVSKDGEFHDVGDVPAGPGEDVDWMELARNNSEADFYKHALQKRLPFMYAKKFWDLGSRTQTAEIGVDYEPDLTRESIELLVHVPSESQSTVVIGPTGCGKSSWAKRVALKPALWVRHMDVLRSFRPGYHKSIIFDDMSFMHLHREAQIHIADQSDESHINCRYAIAIIPPNTQKIFTANSHPFTNDPAIIRRLFEINLY